MNPHRLLLASAGTGKTYRLATHFAALLALGVDPARVLATTFTRKAAGEILDRVLGRLVEAAGDDAAGARARAALTAAAEELAGEALELSRSAAAQRLADLARRIGRFQVRTLDSYFVQVARLFAHELGLAPEWHIADDVEDEELRAEVLGLVIAGLGAPERLALLQAIARQGAPTASHSSLAAAVQGALTLHREATPTAWHQIDTERAPDAERVRAAAEYLCTFELPRKKGKDAEPYANWVKFQQKVREALEREDWRAWLDLSLPKKVRAGEDKFDRVPIPEAVAAACRTIDEQVLATLSSELAAANAATGTLCDLYSARERSVKDRTGAYRFDDFPRALGEGPAGARDEDARAAWLLDLAYRLDTRVAHLLLDEFQDTAPLQWRLLAPLAEEILAGDVGEDGLPRTFFCVGDVKQSIYGWREAEPRLLGEMDQRHPSLAPEWMTESWRSSQVVLDTVNQLFEGLAQRSVFQGDRTEALAASAAAWASGFQPHRRADGAGPCAGAAVLLEAVSVAGNTTQRGKREACIALAVERVKALVERVPEASVAVLVRAKRALPLLLYRLREAGIDASGEGGSPLTDAPLVAQALALLHLADHPGDGVAALAVVHSPFAALFGLEGARPEVQADRPRFWTAAAEVRRALVERGYGAFCERLAEATFAGASAWDRARFRQLVDLGLAYDARASLRPSAFVALVRRERVESPSAARVRVMTVHASKGLEFDAVILPELDGHLTGRSPKLLWYKNGPLDPVTVLSIAPQKELGALREDLAQLADSVKARTLTDELSVLYVAATRAVHHLELIVPPPAQKPSTSSTAAALVREALTGNAWAPPVGASDPGPGVPRGGVELWRHPESDFDWQPSRPRRAAAPEGPALRSIDLAPGARFERAHTASRAAHADSLPSAAELLARPERSARSLGTLVHELLAGLRFAEDEARSDQELAAALARSTTDGAAIQAALTLFRTALTQPAVRAALRRPELAPGETCEIHTERAFDIELEPDEAFDSGSTLWRGSIDRLVVVRRAGQPVRAVVLDYKTDAVDAAAVPARSEAYRPQLEAYRRVVAALYDLPPAAVEAELLFLTPGLRAAL